MAETRESSIKNYQHLLVITIDGRAAISRDFSGGPGHGRALMEFRAGCLERMNEIQIIQRTPSVG